MPHLYHSLEWIAVQVLVSDGQDIVGGVAVQLQVRRYVIRPAEPGIDVRLEEILEAHVQRLQVLQPSAKVVVTAHHVPPVAHQVQDAAPPRRAVGTRTLKIFHGAHSVRALARHSGRRKGLMTLESSELDCVQVVISAVGAVLQVRDGVLDGVEV